MPGGGQEYRRELLERRRVSLPQDFAEGGLFTEPFPSAGGKMFQKTRLSRLVYRREIERMIESGTHEQADLAELCRIH